MKSIMITPRGFPLNVNMLFIDVSYHLLSALRYEILITMELCPNSSLAGYKAVLALDMLGFSYCHMECQDLIQIQLKIQTKL